MSNDLMKRQKKLLRSARRFARLGMGFMATAYAWQANNNWPVSKRQWQNLNDVYQQAKKTRQP